MTLQNPKRKEKMSFEIEEAKIIRAGKSKTKVSPQTSHSENADHRR